MEILFLLIKFFMTIIIKSIFTDISGVFIFMAFYNIKKLIHKTEFSNIINNNMSKIIK